MKIQGPSKTQAPSKTKKTGQKGSPGGGFDSMVSSGPSEAAKPSGSQSIAKVDALLAIQGAEDPAERGSKQRMRQRAGTILQELDKVRMAMLRGDLTVGHMIDIADVVASHREKFSDPALTGIMDEIDLRAQVELAKMASALDRKQA